VPMPTIPVGGMNLGGPIDTSKVAAYAQPNKGTEAWLKRQADFEKQQAEHFADLIPGYRMDKLEGRIAEIEKARKAQAIINEATQKDIVKLEGDHEDWDSYLDKINQRVDNLSARLADLEGLNKAQMSINAETMNHLVAHKLTLERIDARLKRLEVGRG